MCNPNDDGLTDAEIGLVDAMTTLIEVFLASGVEPEVIAQSFEFQRNEHRRIGRTNAAAVLDLLLDFLRDPERRQQRRNLQRMEREPPAGTA